MCERQVREGVEAACCVLLLGVLAFTWRSEKLKRKMSVWPATIDLTNGRYLRGSPTIDSAWHSSYVVVVQPKMMPAAACSARAEFAGSVVAAAAA